jgi:immune inhibitor A
VTTRKAIILAMVAFLCVYLAACGDDDSTPTPTLARSTPTPSATAPPQNATPTPSVSSDEPPYRDLADLARRFRGLPADAPLAVRTQPFDYEVGDSETFSLVDLNIPTSYEVTATVRAISDHAYFFVQEDRSYSESSLATIADDFENLVWPTITSTFGEPQTPGIDGDPRITILHADLRGAGGYVSGQDQFPVEIASLSNEREMLYIDAENLSVPGVPYNGLVAHELQHLIHERYDDGEDSWVNEGLSQVAGQLVGETGDWIPSFLGQPDLQLNAWPPDEDTISHYAAGELFGAYVLDQYGGRENAGILISAPGDGITGYEEYLADFDKSFEEVFADWTVANWLDEEDGRYSHPTLDYTTRESIIADEDGAGTVHQFAADYLEIPNDAGGVFNFAGDTEVSVGVPPNGAAGEPDGAFWWSNRGDAIDSRLTRTLDLSSVASATLTFDAWYDIEDGWDYAYVAASTDGGETWEALPAEGTTTDDPTGQSYGPAFTGRSGGWVGETVDLSAYAGGEVMIRFEYITDDAANSVGFAVDDIEVPEIGFADDENDHGWFREGFLRIDGPVEQKWIVRAIGDSGVKTIAVAEDGTAHVLFGGETVIVVAAITRGTTEPASYSWSFSP